MDELISKRAVIEAIEKARANVGHNLERSIGKSIIEILDDVGRDVDRLPSALSTNLAEVGTDLISRQALLDKFEPWLKVKDYNDGELNMLKAILYEIRFMPSAQPKRGKWIDRGEHESGGRYWHEWECNICHHYFDERTFFCPHCGCDMRGEQYG